MTALPSWAALVRADNPSPMTLEGTNTYVLRAAEVGGHEGAIVVDPGPLDELHLAAVVAAADGHVGLVLLTHGHPDHSDGALLLQEMTGAPMAAADPRFCVGTEPLRAGTHFDGVAGLDVRVLATPGHTADSVSFVVPGDEPGLLTGDTILGRGTTVVAHPDGRLADYLGSLAAGDTTPQQVVRRVYADVDESLWPAAELSVRAQLDYLAETEPSP